MAASPAATELAPKIIAGIPALTLPGDGDHNDDDIDDDVDDVDDDNNDDDVDSLTST